MKNIAKRIFKIIGIVIASVVGLFILLVVIMRVAITLSPSFAATAQYWNASLIVYMQNQEAKWEYNRAAKDTLGGKTPQETLQMYIDAIEKKDYKLASKYFIIGNQSAELKSWENPDRVNIENVIKLLRQDLSQAGLPNLGDKRVYYIHKPLFIEFMQYPSGNWKIVEI